MHIVPTRKAMTCFADLVSHAEPVIKHYHADLFKHDAIMIFKNPGKSFVHTAYDCGTHLYFLPNAVDDDSPIPHLFGHARPSEIARGELEVIRQHFAPNKRGSKRLYACYDGHRVQAVDHSRFVAFYARSYERMRTLMAKNFSACSKSLYHVAR